MNVARCIEISKALYRPGHSERTFHVTFICRKKRILSIGINHANTHPITLKYDYKSLRNGADIRDRVGLHSELSALLKLGEDDTSRYDFLNVRLDKNGRVCYSKPCSGCQSALNQFGFRNFFFTNGEKDNISSL